MELGKVFVDSVIVGQRHRALDPSRIEALAESMDALGLQQPISVYMDEQDGAHLIAGLHRLEAARALRWEQIDASFVKLSPVRREMWEIAENLFRVDLTKEQRDEHIRRYAELIERADNERILAQNEPVFPAEKRTRGQPKAIARRIADETGLSKSTVQRALNPPTSISRRVVKIADAPLSEEDAKEKWVAAGIAWWNRGAQEWREEFKARVDAPIMDQRFGT